MQNLEGFCQLNKIRRSFSRISRNLHAIHGISLGTGFYTQRCRELKEIEYKQCIERIHDQEMALGLKANSYFDINPIAPSETSVSISNIRALDIASDWFVSKIASLRSNNLDLIGDGSLKIDEFDIKENEYLSQIIQIEDRIRYFESFLPNEDYHQRLVFKALRSLDNFTSSIAFNQENSFSGTQYRMLMERIRTLKGKFIDDSMTCRFGLERQMKRSEFTSSVLDSSAYLRTTTIKRSIYELAIANCL